MGNFDEDKEYFNEILPYKYVILEEVLKHLCFFLKENTYLKKDCLWLIEKVENKVNLWFHCWFSRGGRLVLIKDILEASIV
jgi:hypothetical protein